MHSSYADLDEKRRRIYEMFREQAAQQAQNANPFNAGFQGFGSAGARTGYIPPVQPRQPSIEEIFVAFIKALPYDAAKSAYKRAAAMLHPDVTGDNGERMKILNAAWARIEKEYYGK